MFNSPEFIIAGIFLFGVIVWIFKGIFIVKQNECLVIEKLGKYHRTLGSGVNLIIPFIDNPRQVVWLDHGMITRDTRVDLRETILDIPEQSVITKDNVSIVIDALMYVQVTDPVKAAYEISNLPLAVSQLAQTSLRNVIGEMELDESLTSRDQINGKLKMILDEATDKWGLKVNRVELKNISPPADVQQAMEKQMQAERERRAKVLDAEGDKQARIQRSEGIKQEKINTAEGERTAQIKMAEGQSQAISLVADAQKRAISDVNDSLKDQRLTASFLVAMQYLEKFEKFIAQEGDKIYVPYEATSSIAGIGGIKDMLSKLK